MVDEEQRSPLRVVDEEQRNPLRVVDEEQRNPLRVADEEQRSPLRVVDEEQRNRAGCGGPRNQKRFMRGPLCPALAVFAAALLLYLVSLAPDVLWGDNAQFQRAAAHFDPDLGTRGYPLYRLVIRLAGATGPGNLAFRVNLVSALCGAAAVALLFYSLRRLGLPPFPSAAATAALALSHEFWSQSVVAEVYSLHALLLAGIAATVMHAARLTPRRILLLGLLLALGWLHHRTILFIYPACLLLLWLRRRDLFAGRAARRATAASLLLVLVPILAILLFGPEQASPGSGLLDALRGGDPPFTTRLLYFGKFLTLNFPSPAPALFAVGLVLALRRCGDARYAFLLAAFAVHAVAPLTLRWYGDQHVFLLPAYLFLAPFAALGLAWLATHRRRLALAAGVLSAILPPLAYLSLAHHYAQAGSDAPFSARSDYARLFFLPPKTGYRQPRRFAEDVLGRLPPNARLVSTWGERQTILYLQETEDLRPDITVLEGDSPDRVRLEIEAGAERLFLTLYPYFADHRPPPPLPSGYHLERDGPVYAVVPD